MQVANFNHSVAYSSWPQPDLAAKKPDTQASPSASSASGSSEGPSSGVSNASNKPTAAEQIEQLELTRMVQRDREVRLHEQAHAAIGGRHAGAPTYSYERGTDGKRYAVAGEVSIDVSAVPNDPEATVRKMEVVIRAALSPAEPSAQDRQIAAQAQIRMAEAFAEVARTRREETEAARETRAEQREENEQKATENDNKKDVTPASATSTALELYRQMSGVKGSDPLIDLAI
ncbi:putative metalloprotease CJM1_0395 family protein [Ectopseudomonas mendocina]|uniref:Metalloprotease CJM1_0395 family protein n=1 Tax=Ectopseudomonas mendocina TaxID=300 RepID=A0ABZ2RMG0_ECTME